MAHPIGICGIGLYFIGYKSDPYNIGGLEKRNVRDPRSPSAVDPRKQF